MLRALFTAGVVGIGGIALAQAAEEVWVKSSQAKIWQGKGPVGLVATAKKGEKLTIMAREDKWMKVQYEDKQGYVMETAVSPKKIGSGAGAGDMLAGGSDTSGMDTSLAGRGLREEAMKYADAKNLDPKVVEQMMERNRAITFDEWTAFQKAGKVGPEGKK
ncbi:MAG TPA: hypothetical protein VGR35_16290 [Tepidisphaeraceae bacterium]|nr:hypothetical protein [Tepidisphaeraceae bacterium]